MYKLRSRIKINVMGKVMIVFLMATVSINAQQWNTDLDTAFEKAMAHDKNVLLFFTVPDFCERCDNLERNVLKSDEFLEYATANFVLARIEFSKTPGFFAASDVNAENLLIVEKYNKDGFFPLVVILNKYRRVIGKVGVYNEERPRQYVEMLQSLENN